MVKGLWVQSPVQGEKKSVGKDVTICLHVLLCPGVIFYQTESVWLHCYCCLGPSRRAVIPGWGTRHFLPCGTGGSRSIVFPPASLHPCQVQSGGVEWPRWMLHRTVVCVTPEDSCTQSRKFSRRTLNMPALFLAPERDIIFISLCRKQFSPLFQELMLNLSPQALFSQLLKKEEFVTNLSWKL